jgi:hypothetical protein
MNTEGTGSYTCKECHNTESLQNHTTTVHKEREQLGDRRNAGESSYNSGDGTGQMAQPLMFMMMMKFLFIVLVHLELAVLPSAQRSNDKEDGSTSFYSKFHSAEGFLYYFEFKAFLCYDIL